MNDLVGTKSIFYFPENFTVVLDGESVTFQKFEAIFDKFQEQDVFSVRVDDLLWIGKDFKLTDDETKKAFFGSAAKDSKGNERKYKSIHGRVGAVYAALCEGSIKIGEINKVED